MNLKMTRARKLRFPLRLLEVRSSAASIHGTLIDTGQAPQEAYQIAAARFKRGLYAALFTDQRDLTDAVQKAVQDGAVSCGWCDNLLN